MSIPNMQVNTRGDDVSFYSKTEVIEQESATVAEQSQKQIQRIVHKIDRRLIPMAGLLVAICLLDRANLSNAVIAG